MQWLKWTKMNIFLKLCGSACEWSESKCIPITSVPRMFGGLSTYKNLLRFKFFTNFRILKSWYVIRPKKQNGRESQLLWPNSCAECRLKLNRKKTDLLNLLWTPWIGRSGCIDDLLFVTTRKHVSRRGLSTRGLANLWKLMETSII